MPLQTPRLVMVGLGSRGDVPPDAIQPKLLDGVHLRWAFPRELGFPWYGFYLFRRDHRRSEMWCISGMIRELKPGSWLSQTLALPQGTFSSDRDLVLTDDFPPSPIVEFDLQERRFLRFTLRPDRLSNLVQIRIGIRKTPERKQRCLRFLDKRENSLPNPYSEDGFRLRASNESAIIMLRSLTARNKSIIGLDCEPQLEIKLPEAARQVTLNLGAKTRDSFDIEAEQSDGEPAVVSVTDGSSASLHDVRIDGEDIRLIRIRTKPRTKTLLHSVCLSQERQGANPDIRVTARFGEGVVAETTMSGTAGDVVDATLEADAISSVEISGGAAALIDLCFEALSQGAAFGWKPLDRALIALPVRHPDYPADSGNPDLPSSRSTALDRITYGDPGDWAAAFPDLHEALLLLVSDGPPGPPMADKLMPQETGTPAGANGPLPHLSDSRALDLVLLATLNRAVADMIGLSYVDKTADPSARYDYLIIASHNGAGAGSAGKMLNEIATNGFANVDAWIVFNKTTEASPPLAAPTGARSYALPGTTLASQGTSVVDATNNAGLRWTLPTFGGILLPGRPAMYLVWRAENGNDETPVAGPFELATKLPILVADPILPAGSTPQRASDWPPFSLHYIDVGLAEGWYAYQVTGIDIFGRHSKQSKKAAWYQWEPEPEPSPWYYIEPPANRLVHAEAVRLLDKSPPPPPTAIEAYALDPADPTVLRDAAYQAWFGTLNAAEQRNVVGLRVRWQWTAALARQAPDATEFRIYYQPGRPNALLGNVKLVAAITATESEVKTDIPNAAQADAFVGASLRIGALSFPIVASAASDPLTVVVSNLGLTETAGTVTVTSGSAQVAGSGTAWHAGMNGLSFAVAGTNQTYTILSVDSATGLRLATLYSGANAAGQGYTVFDVRPPARVPATIVIPERYAAGSVALSGGSAVVTGNGTLWGAALVGMRFKVQADPARYRVAAVNSAAELLLDRVYGGPSGANLTYAISFPLFTDYREATNWDQRFYVVDFDDHVEVTQDGAGLPLRKYEVIIPAGADAARNGVPLVTSLAEPVAYAQVSVSTADDKLHTPDAPKWVAGSYGNRPGNEGNVGSMATVFRVRRERPPPPKPPPDAERVFATPADYHSLSFYTYRWAPTAHLKTHIFRAVDDAVFQEDWRHRPRPPLNPDDLALFPSEPRWNALKRQQVATELDQLNSFAPIPSGKALAFAVYRKLSNDGLRILAGLPANDRAFTQITTYSLDPDDPLNADRRGPDSAAGYAPNPALRAYMDTLDGRSTSRYFYRAAYVDGANNIGPLGLSSPPVWLPNVVPPRAPVLTRVLGGDRAITVYWASNREIDLAKYRLYRSDREADERDLRLMTMVHEENVPAGDPSQRPAQLLFTDTPLQGLVTFYYRLVAIDSAGNVSVPSAPASGRGYDESLPVVPLPVVAWVEVAGVTRAKISWTSVDETMLQRRDPGRSWVEIASWRPPGSHEIRDPFSDSQQTYEYRLWSRKTTGAISKGVGVTLVHM